MAKKKKEKKKHYWWRFLLVFIAGMLTTVLVTVGGLALTATVVPVSAVIGMTGTDASQIIGEEYLNGSMLQLVMSIVNDASSGNIQTLGGVAKYSPMVESYLDDLNTKYIKEYLGFELDMEEVKELKFDELGTYLLDHIQSESQLAAIIGATGQNIDPSLEALLYYEDGTPVAIGDLVQEGGFDRLLHSIALADVLNVNYDEADDIMKSLLWREVDDPDNPGMTILQKVTIGDLTGNDGLTTVLGNVALAKLVGVDTDYEHTTGIMKVLCFNNDTTHSARTIGDLISGETDFDALINDLPLADLMNVTWSTELDSVTSVLCFEDDEDHTPIKLGAYLGGSGFDGLIEKIYLADVLNITYDSADGIMKTLCFHDDEEHTKVKISELTGEGGIQTIIDNITLASVLNVPEDTEDEFMKTLCYRTEVINEVDTLVAITIKEVKEDPDFFNNIVNDIPLNKIVTSDDDIAKIILYPKIPDPDNPGHTKFDTAHPRTVGDLNDDGAMTDILNNAKLGEFLTIDPDNPLYKFKDKTIAELTGSEFSFCIADFIEVSSDDMLFPIRNIPVNELGQWFDEHTFGDLFGSEGLLGVFADVPLNAENMGEQVEAKLKAKKINEMFSGDLGDLSLLGNFSINQLMDMEGNNIKINQLFDLDGLSGLAQAIGKFRIDELNDANINGLTIEEVFGSSAGDNAIIQALIEKDATIGGEKGVDKVMGQIKLESLLGGIEDDPTAPGYSALLDSLREATLDTIEDDIKAITVGDLITAEGSTVLDALKPLKIGEIDKTAIDTVIKDLKISDVINTTGVTSGILYAISDWKLGEINVTKINGLTIAQIFPDYASNTILKNLGTATLGGMNDAVDDLELGDIVDMSGGSTPYVLTQFEHTALGDLSDAFNGLTLGQVFSPSQLNENKFLKSLPADTPIDEVASALSNLRIEEVFCEEVFAWSIEAYRANKAIELDSGASPEDKAAALSEREGRLSSEWKYLLIEGGKSYANSKRYTIMEMGSLITNFQWHMKHETVNSLSSDGFVTISGEMLTRTTPNTAGLDNVTVDGEVVSLRNKQYGTLTVGQFMYVVNYIMNNPIVLLS